MGLRASAETATRNKEVEFSKKMKGLELHAEEQRKEMVESRWRIESRANELRAMEPDRSAFLEANLLMESRMDILKADLRATLAETHDSRGEVKVEWRKERDAVLSPQPYAPRRKPQLDKGETFLVMSPSSDKLRRA